MRLSVVVTIVDGGETLERCLAALAVQTGTTALEVVVPWDETVAGIPALAARFLQFRFLRMGPVATARPAAGAAGQHELFDRRRTAGLAAVTGDVVAILEDRGVPRPDWAVRLAGLHERLPHAVIGGAIENGRARAVNWAVYFCDFGRYHLPFADGPREWVSDVNIGYKRRALEQTRELWRDRYHETTVHWALQRAGETLWLAADPVVDQMRDILGWTGLISERFAWGRLFAYTRAREMSIGRRLMFAAVSPLLPLLLIARHARVQAGKRRTFGTFLRVSPIVFVLLGAWSVGEAAGYLTGEP